MKGDVRKRVLATPGVQSNGQVITLDDLIQVTKNFNPDAPVPVTPGHPKSDSAPALGRVRKVAVEDGVLVGEVFRSPAMIRLEEEGHYAGWSVGLHRKPDNTFYLHHLAALGQHPPASEIKDLGVVELAQPAGDDLIILDQKFKEDDVGVDEKTQKLIDEAVKKALEQSRRDDAAKIAELEKKLAEAEKKTAAETGGDKPADDKSNKEKEDGGKDNADDQGGNKELSVALKALASERRKGLIEAGNKKGLTEEHLKPVLELLDKQPVVNLAAAEENNPYDLVRKFIEGLPEPSDDLTGRVRLGDSGGDEPVDASAMCAKV